MLVKLLLDNVVYRRAGADGPWERRSGRGWIYADSDVWPMLTALAAAQADADFYRDDHRHPQGNGNICRLWPGRDGRCERCVAYDARRARERAEVARSRR